MPVSSGIVQARRCAGKRIVTSGFKPTTEFFTRGNSLRRVNHQLATSTTGHCGEAISSRETSGSQFALLPPDNATGNFTKVIRRVPDKIALDDPELAAKLRRGSFRDRNCPHQAISRHTMDSRNDVTRPTPAEIASATAAAIPSEISTRPLLGIVGVLIGAGLVTLTGRMLLLGLADLRGHVGISSDQGAWFDSAYNAAIMFIGPL